MRVMRLLERMHIHTLENYVSNPVLSIQQHPLLLDRGKLHGKQEFATAANRWGR